MTNRIIVGAEAVSRFKDTHAVSARVRYESDVAQIFFKREVGDIVVELDSPDTRTLRLLSSCLDRVRGTITFLSVVDNLPTFFLVRVPQIVKSSGRVRFVTSNRLYRDIPDSLREILESK